MYSLVGSCVSWLHANLQVLSLCHCSILNQFPLKKMIKKERRKSRKKLRWYTWAYKFYPCGFFFFWVLRKPQKIHPSFCVHMNGKVKQSSEKSQKKIKNKKPSFLSMAEDSHRILVDLISKCSPACSWGW